MGQLSHRPNALQRGLHPVLRTKLSGWFLAHTLHHFDGPVLRLSRGRYSLTSLLAGLPVVTLTTIGAKSGQPRSMPLVAMPSDEQVILIASNFGQKHHPGWYYNIRANPEVQLAYAGRTIAYVARETAGAEREAYWQKAAQLYSGYALYQQRAQPRQIPVLLLTLVQRH